MTAAASVLLGLLGLFGQAQAGKDLEELRRLNRSGPVDLAVDRGLKYLLGQQNGEGAFGRKNQTALTALSIMAYLAAGHVPGESPEGKAVEKGLEYLLAEGRQKEDGYFGDSDGSRMYGHGIATLLLAEALGMGAREADDRRFLLACRRGTDLILKSQEASKEKLHAGGWRYSPASTDSDLSVTVWQVMALRAAKNCGMEVPERAVQEAVGFIDRCFQPAAGGFSYQPGNLPTPAMTAAGLLSLEVCGVRGGREVQAGADRLKRRPIQWEDPWFYYGIYYYAQAMHQLGEEEDQKARSVAQGLLLGRQAADGSWPPPPKSQQEESAGPIYRTALAILALSVEYRFLPIYQR